MSALDDVAGLRAAVNSGRLSHRQSQALDALLDALTEPADGVAAEDSPTRQWGRPRAAVIAGSGFVLDPAGQAALDGHVKELRRRGQRPASIYHREQTVRRFAAELHRPRCSRRPRPMSRRG